MKKASTIGDHQQIIRAMRRSLDLLEERVVEGFTGLTRIRTLYLDVFNAWVRLVLQ